MSAGVLRMLIAIHIAAGLVAVGTGATAMLARKGPGRHPRSGIVYLGALAAVVATASCIVIARPHTAYLLIPGAVAVVGAGVGYAARRVRWAGWLRHHILGMATSYTAMLTAFYVDNGPQLPLWRELPPSSFWFLPSAVGLPIVLWTLRRHTATGTR